jgi:hypothetical protein
MIRMRVILMSTCCCYYLVVERIGAQSRELKDKVGDVIQDESSKIPEVGDYTLKFKQKLSRRYFYTLVGFSLGSAAAVYNSGSSIFLCEIANLNIYSENGFGNLILESCSAHFEAVCDSLFGCAYAIIHRGWLDVAH